MIVRPQNLLRKKAAEELKREQERRAEERRKIIRQRTGEPKGLDGINEGKPIMQVFITLKLFVLIW